MSKSLVQQKGLSLGPINPANPAELGFPPSLPVELAMGLNPIKAVCEEYGFTREELAALCENPIFAAEYNAALGVRAADGGLFRLKAGIMAELALETQFVLMNDTTMPPSVRLKASENIIEASDKMPKRAAGGTAGPGFTINIDLSPRRDEVSIRTIESE